MMYTITLQAVPAQTLSVQLGANLLRLKIQWMARFNHYRIDIAYLSGELITGGRIMNIGADLLDGLYPTKYLGQMYLIGEEPNSTNLGINNELVWIDGPTL